MRSILIMKSIHINATSMNDVDVAIFFTHADSSLINTNPYIERRYPFIEVLAQKRRFKGALLDTLVLPFFSQNDSVCHSIIVGMGKMNDHNIIRIEDYRRAVGKAIRTAVSLHSATVEIHLPHPALFNVTQDYLVEQTTIIIQMAQYHFDDFITQQDRKETPIASINLCISDSGQNQDTLQKSLDKGVIIAQAVNTARHWIDSPPIHLTPSYLAQKARDIAAAGDLDITVLQEAEIIKMGMGGLAAVSAGSEQDCQLVIMEYRTVQENAPTLAFVGKGITFDSGGLSLKPAQSMETMKEDMSGAAAVIATMQVIAQLKPLVNIIALAPLSENLPSGKATKPGDIIRFYNGKTAEVKNTDAEGRLILADALSYAVKHYNPDAIIDLATLTGACAYALGPFYSGLMSEHDNLVEKIEQAAKIAGECVWRLPMGDDYKKAIKSDVSDMSNIGDGRIKAGAITAAHFLQNFVGQTPWAHLDIAGTAFDVPNISYYRSGATGVGVRMLVELALNWK